jgi:segregation and condensation protein B
MLLFIVCLKTNIALEYLAQHIESLIFTTEHPISTQEIQSCLEETFETPFEVEELEKTLGELKARYKEKQFAFELVEIANGFQFLTKGAYHQTIGTYLKQTTKKRLSKAALETLSMIAYKQPVSKTELENIRGVSCDYSIQKLLEKELVTILGRAETPGRPLLYGTTEKFMDYFGIKSMKDLPKPKDFRTPDSEVGEVAPIEEEIPHDEKEPGTANVDDQIVDEDELLMEENESTVSDLAVSIDDDDDEETILEEVEQEVVNEDNVIQNENSDDEKEYGISNADVSIEDLNDAFDQEEE